MQEIFYFPKKFIFSLPIVDWSVEWFLRILHVFFNYQRYLERYGYLSPSDVQFGQVKSKWKLYQAVRNLQRFTGLNETGNPADPNTINMVTKQRCGFRDLGKTAQFRRKKRYSLHGTFWRKNVSLSLYLMTELIQVARSGNWRKQERSVPYVSGYHEKAIARPFFSGSGPLLCPYSMCVSTSHA